MNLQTIKQEKARLALALHEYMEANPGNKSKDGTYRKLRQQYLDTCAAIKHEEALNELVKPV